MVINTAKREREIWWGSERASMSNAQNNLIINHLSSSAGARVIAGEVGSAEVVFCSAR